MGHGFSFRRALLAGCLSVLAAPVGAISTSFTGDFAQDTDVALFTFSTDGSSTITLRSYGYAGGTQGDGNVVADGGFDPLLTLWDDTGHLIGTLEPNGYLNDDGDYDANGNLTSPADCTLVSASSSGTGLCLDSLYSGILSAGTYWLALTESNNYGPDFLANPFAWDGNPGDYSATAFGCAGGQPFCDYGQNVRDGHWALDIQGVTLAQTQTRQDALDLFTPPPATVPAPSTLALAGLGLAGLAGRRKRSALA